MSDDLPEKTRRTLASIRRALGPVITAALDDPSVTDILVNPDGQIWIERMGQPMVTEGLLQAVNTMTAINALASLHETIVRADNPILSCELPDGSRFEANVPPVSVGGPSFAIRKKASRMITLDEYVASGTMSTDQRTLIVNAVTAHSNIIVAGATGSGKTTLTNAIIAQMVAADPTERIYIIEDLSELQCIAQNKVVKRATEHASMVDLLRSALRQRPDRILIGEVRGGEAYELMKAWGMGHPGGVCTIHAGGMLTDEENYQSIMRRLQSLCAEHPACPASQERLDDWINEVTDLVIYIARENGQRRVQMVRNQSPKA